ncbi:MAG: hypothetical protein WA652_18525 [Xanthobacteraceae bacterium]
MAKGKQPVGKHVAERAQTLVEISDIGQLPAPINGGGSQDPKIALADCPADIGRRQIATTASRHGNRTDAEDSAGGIEKRDVGAEIGRLRIGGQPCKRTTEQAGQYKIIGSSEQQIFASRHFERRFHRSYNSHIRIIANEPDRPVLTLQRLDDRHAVVSRSIINHDNFARRRRLGRQRMKRACDDIAVVEVRQNHRKRHRRLRTSDSGHGL